MKNNLLAVGVGLALIISLVALLTGGNDGVVGATAPTTTFNATIRANEGLRVGSAGTSIARINSGFCTLNAYATTITATTTAAADCYGASGTGFSALTGVTSGDVCTLTFATSSNQTYGGLVFQSVSASSTAGAIHARVLNLTGATFTWTATATSSVAYRCVDPL